MNESDERRTTTVSIKDLSALLQRVFERNGCSQQVASILADNCASAERDGAFSHGLMRIPGYVQTLKSGYADGRAIPALEDVAPGLVRVDAKNGFAQPALAVARRALISKAKANGVALLAIRNSHHLAALSLDVEPFANDGLIALSVLNALTTVVPHGAKAPVFGTNPIAFATPRGGGAPIVFDMATSFLAKGDVQIAARDGHLLPVGAGIDKYGQQTVDPKAVLDGGALMPFGGHKGSALAMMVEILCAALVGSDFSFEVDRSAYPGAGTARTGQTLILIDPSVGASGLRDFSSRVELLTQVLRSAGQERMPGDRRQTARAKSIAQGITINAEVYSELHRFCTA